MEIHIKIVGIIFILLALVHGIFPKYFNWKNELATLNLINKQMMQVHTFFIALVVLLMGILCVSSSHELVTTTLGKRICLGFGMFWGARLVIQFFGYSSKLWNGKKFETVIHILFSALWTYTTAVFLLVFLQ
jgi:hypothetical protein